MSRYILSLGSNIEPERNLAAAVRLLRERGTLIAASSVYVSAPFGDDRPQPDYLNAVVVLESELRPQDFLETVIRPIEAGLGRRRSADRFAPRTIDIDILLVDREVLKIGRRRIPSREILERSFVAIPLAETAPDLVHPTDGRTMAEIAAGFTEKLKMHPLNLGAS